MITKSTWLISAAFVLSLGLTACNDSDTDVASGTDSNSQPDNGSDDGSVDEPGGGTEGPREFKVKDVTIEPEADTDPDTQPTVSFFTSEDGRLGIRVNGVDLGDGSGVREPVIGDVNIEPTTDADGSAPMAARRMVLTDAGPACEILDTGKSGSGDKFDIVVSLDTTGSMGYQASIFAEKIVDFAGALEDQGLDVRFAGVTVGDAFATLNPDTGSDYASSIAQGSLGTPPGFDLAERPDTGTELVDAEDMKSFFGEVSDVVGSGQGGGDSPENYLAAIDYFNQTVTFREDAGRFFLAIGDECAHTADSLPGSGDNASWLPRTPETIEDDLVNEGVAVNLIWADTSCGAPYYDMHTLQKATGGAWTELNDDVDLTDLPTIAAVGAKRKTLACTVPVAGREFTVTFEIAAGDDAKWLVTALLETTGR